MNNSPEYYIDLITRYFSGEASPGETDELSAWVKESEENRKLFTDYRKAWDLTQKAVIDRVLDTDREWTSFKSRLSSSVPADEPKVVRLEPAESQTGRGGRPWLKIAAVMILLIAAAGVMYYYYQGAQTTVITAEAGVLTHTLPDGSVITLNKGAQIRYAAGFLKKRSVELSGEAYFEVTHDPSHPFIVEGNNARVEVLGTRFNVNTQNQKGNMSVVLTEGKVSLYFADRNADKVILTPGEQAEISASAHMIIKTGHPDMNYMAWKTQKIVFEDVPLRDIVLTLSAVYHVNIQLASPSTGNCRVTATFDHQPVTAVLNVLKNTLDLQVSKQGNDFILSGKACN